MSTQPAPSPQAKTLYVICHGALATLQTDHNLIVMIPDMGSAHSYRIGTWLSETTIEKGSLHALENVDGGTASVSNLFHVAPRADIVPRPPFATFILPRPIKVHSLFEVNIAKSAFSSADGAVIPDNDVVAPLVPIFEYTYTTTPRLGNIWPLPADDADAAPSDPATLHIFAEDEVPLDDGHFVAAFNRTCQLLGVNVRLTPQAAGNPLSPGDLGTVPPNMNTRLFELQPLARRRAAMQAIARAKESGATLADPWLSLPTDLTTLGDLFFGQPSANTAPAATAKPPAFAPRWKNPACVHVILGNVPLANAS